ncbi:methyltransferase domain-containing protein [Salinisphaera sp. SWV1]
MPFRQDLIKYKRIVTPYRTNPDNDWLALEQGLDQIELIRAYHGDLTGKVALEMGTGWQPTIPMLLSLLDCEKIILTDVERLISYSTVVDAMSFISQNREKIAARLGLSPDGVARSLGRALSSDFDELLKNLRMSYVAPYRISEFEPGSVDVIYSRAVLEHIARDDLAIIFKEQRSLLKSGGVMCHIIDNSDHWEHKDKALSRVNFLRYNALSWRVINSRGQLYQNRMRHSEYVKLLESCGYRIVFEKCDMDSNAAKDAASMKLAKRFRKFDSRDLAGVTSYLVCSVV